MELFKLEVCEMKTSEILESFVSNICDLTSKDLEKLLVKEYGKIKILHSVFRRLVDKTDAEYSIVSEDKDEEEFLINIVRVCAKLGSKNEVTYAAPIPDKTFKTLPEAKAYADKTTGSAAKKLDAKTKGQNSLQANRDFNRSK